MIYNQLRYFSWEEFDDPEKMSPQLLAKLDQFRHTLGQPIKVTSSTRGVHSANSEHPRGRAVDIVICGDMGWVEQFLEIERYRFPGLGFYPDWQYKDWRGGWHLDVRELDSCRAARWVGVGHPNQYLPMSEANFIKYMMQK